VKALGGPDGLSWTEISVERDSLGRPWLRTQGASAQRLDEVGADRIHLSISHDGGLLTAYVVAETTSGGTNA
jgi:holo-[acyl-carrier protein] synthase